MLDIFVDRDERLEGDRMDGVRVMSLSTTKFDLGRGETGCPGTVGRATGTTGASVGTVALLENRSKRFWRNRRYSSSFSKPSAFATRSSSRRCASVRVAVSVCLRGLVPFSLPAPDRAEGGTGGGGISERDGLRIGAGLLGADCEPEKSAFVGTLRA